LAEVGASLVSHIYGSRILGLRVAACARTAQGVLRLPRAYLLRRWALFVSYLVSFCLAIGLATMGRSGRVGSLTTCGLAHARLLCFLSATRRWLFCSRACGSRSVARSSAPRERRSRSRPCVRPRRLRRPRRRAPLPTSRRRRRVTWALYSNLSRRSVPKRPSAVPLFLFATGAVLLLARALIRSQATGRPRGLGVGFHGTPARGRYGLWELAMRKGHLVLVARCVPHAPVLHIILCALQRLPMRRPYGSAAPSLSVEPSSASKR